MEIKADKIILKATNWVGDVVISLPALKAIKSLYNDSEFTVVCKPYLREIYENLGFIDRTVCLGSNSPGAFYRLSRQINREGYDLGILFQNAINGALLFYFAGIPRRLGYPTDARGIFLTDKPRDKYENTHQMDRYLGLARYLGFEGQAPSPYIPTGFDEHKGKREFLYSFLSRGLNRQVPESRHIIGIAPGAKYGPAKMWGEGNFRELIRLLLEQKNINILLIGSREDDALSERIISGFSPERVFNTSGRFELLESLYIIGELDMLVSNDSGAMHMAAARDTRITALFGPTVFSHTSPLSQKAEIFFKRVECWPCRHRTCPRDTHGCMEQIKPAEVFESILRRISD